MEIVCYDEIEKEKICNMDYTIVDRKYYINYILQTLNKPLLTIWEKDNLYIQNCEFLSQIESYFRNEQIKTDYLFIFFTSSRSKKLKIDDYDATKEIYTNILVTYVKKISRDFINFFNCNNLNCLYHTVPPDKIKLGYVKL
jgi:hypothetical protein